MKILLLAALTSRTDATKIGPEQLAKVEKVLEGIQKNVPKANRGVPARAAFYFQEGIAQDIQAAVRDMASEFKEGLSEIVSLEADCFEGLKLKEFMNGIAKCFAARDESLADVSVAIVDWEVIDRVAYAVSSEYWGSHSPEDNILEIKFHELNAAGGARIWITLGGSCREAWIRKDWYLSGLFR